MPKIRKPLKTDNVIYDGHFTLVSRPGPGKDYDVIVSDDAAAMLYIDEKDMAYMALEVRTAMRERDGEDVEILALPAETLDKPHLSALETMVEGLKEECGVKINNHQVNYWSRSISSAGHDTERTYLFLAHGKGEQVGQRLEDTERIEVVKMPFDELYEKVMNGDIEDSKTKELVMYEKLRRLGEL
jgi:hypothetical protein